MDRRNNYNCTVTSNFSVVNFDLHPHTVYDVLNSNNDENGE